MLKGDGAMDIYEDWELFALQLQNWLKSNDGWAFVIMNHHIPYATQPSQTNTDHIINEFLDVFFASKQLPPSRPFDHHITLLPSFELVNTRTQRYSPFHKTEIEKQVTSLLEARFVVPSVSLFVSPVLLVKKYGTQRFCVDYRN